MCIPSSICRIEKKRDSEIICVSTPYEHEGRFDPRDLKIAFWVNCPCTNLRRVSPHTSALEQGLYVLILCHVLCLHLEAA